jgi:hypothetical protein
LSVSARSRRHNPVQLVTPRIRHNASRRASARWAAVANQSGWVSIATCTISTEAAISSTPGIEFSVV